LKARLNDILRKLTGEAPHEDAIELEVHVIRSPVLNAFALPDGSLFIACGLLAELDSFDEVAFVLGHEAQHSLGWHAQKNIAQGRDKATIWEGLSVIIGVAAGGSWGGLFAQLGLDLAAMASISGYGRGLESEADEQGMAFLEQAGYDPCAGLRALDALRRNSAEQGSVANFFWGSHPKLSSRIEDIQEGISTPCDAAPDEEADPDYAEAVKWPMTRLTAGLWLKDDRPDMARPSAERYAEVFDQDPDAHALLGEVYLRYDEVVTRVRLGDLLAPKDEGVQADVARYGEGALLRATGAFERALTLADSNYKPALLGLALTYEARGDTLTCIDFLERYLEGDEKVPRRRAMKRKLRELRESFGQMGSGQERLE
jgi:tetratricopeptide (TPR) repeat protein